MSFTRGPSSPMDACRHDPKRAGDAPLKPSPSGHKPAKYRIYGGDEKGFTVSDDPFAVVGVSKEVPSVRPAIRRGGVGDRVCCDRGGCQVPNANHLLPSRGRGRQGIRRAVGFGAPRPIAPRPVTDAKVGSNYRYTLSAIRSIPAICEHAWSAARDHELLGPGVAEVFVKTGPDWLKIDAGTGVLSGVPDRLGSLGLP